MRISQVERLALFSVYCLAAAATVMRHRVPAAAAVRYEQPP